MGTSERDWNVGMSGNAENGMGRANFVAGGFAAAGRARQAFGIGLLGVVAFVASLSVANAAAKEDKVFTIGNYPVEAKATNAVEAKERAISEGQQAALRSLLRRIVPVTSYHRIGKLKSVKAGDLIDGLAVRSERNSSTEYIASYDFTFQAEAVRRMLDREGIPFLDRQAPSVILVPVYRAPADTGTPEIFTDARGSDAWLYAWKGLDLANALSPVSLQALKREVHLDTVKAIVAGEPGGLRTMGREYQTETLLVALMEPDLSTKKVTVTIAGRDAVAPFVLKRIYKLDGPDLSYTAELAAVMALSVLEGRWKAINVRGGASASAARDGYRDGAQDPRDAPPRTGSDNSGNSAGAPVYSPTRPPMPGSATASGQQASADGLMRIAVEFRSMGEWTQISRQLSSTPEISDLEVEGLSGRSARLALRYPGGPQNLALTLAQNGLILRSNGGGWLLTLR